MARQTHIPTSDHLRRRIDHGELGDKVNYPDPAAAPLGTDDEAAGHSPTPAQLALAAEQPTPAPHPRTGMMALVALMLLITLVAMVSLSALLWR